MTHTPADFDKQEIEGSLVARLSRVVDRHGDRIALSDDHGPLTFRELAATVGRVAARVLACRADDPVAILLEPGASMVTALWGVVAAGRPYVPLDPSFPRSQLAHMVADCGAKLLLAGGSTIDLARELAVGGEVVDLASIDEPGPPLDTLAERSGASSQACILYTSGSTGLPKGIIQTHRAIAHFVWSNVARYSLGPSDHLALVFSPSYAASLSEIFGATLTGASLALASAKRMGMGALAAWVRRERISILKLPIALFRVFLRSLGPDDRFPDVRTVLLGGDALFGKDVERFRAHFEEDCLLVNRLASSEVLSITHYPIERALELDDRVVPVGYPDHDVELTIVDDGGRPLPPGELGQIVVKSRYVSPGYWQRDELSRASFVPASDTDPRVTFRTGDLGRLRTDGCLEHFGRRDSLVKLRGYRIELAAVEAALEALDAVKEAAAAVADSEGEGDVKRLVGYVVPADGRALRVGALRSALARSLPEFMVPSAFVTLAELPRTPTGKVDRRSLPAPSAVRPRLEGPYVRPRTEIERQLGEIWSEVLGLGAVGVHDNFFDLGGDSLHLLRVHARLCRDFSIDIPVVELFARPTVGAMAAWLATPEPAAGHERLRVPTTLASIEPELAVAVIGMSGVFPGATNVDELWENLRAGVESIGPLSEEELEAAAVGAELREHPDYVTTVPELPDFRRLDAGFFGLTPVEATILDPQQRMLLECAWHALEHAAVAPGKTRGRIGVFAGAGQSAYLQRHLLPRRDRLPPVSDLQLRLATDPEFLATRIAYKLDLSGPAVNVATACSTSLVAIHLACRALIAGECEIALAGGASVESTERAGYLYEEGWISSRDGHCRPFDAGAQGTVFGCGAGLVVLERLDRAIAERRTIHAVVRGSAVNNDGARKVGFAAPSVDGQVAVIAAAQQAAGVPGDAIDYVEAHGTGTALGDPIEIAALRQAFRQSSLRSGFCAVGSIKANIGHLSRAAGVAGFIKVVLALAHGEIPPSPYFTAPNPRIALDGSPFFVAAAGRAWPTRSDGKRRAAVSSFGVGGTNAHAILEHEVASPREPERAEPTLLLVSARSPTALDHASHALADHVRQHPEVRLDDAAFTLQVGRHDFALRRAIVCRNRNEAVEKLASGAGRTRQQEGSPPSLVFLFPGQGAQYVQMGRGLYDTEPSYRADVDRCAERLEPALGLDLREILFPPAERSAELGATLRRTHITQPALFVAEWSMARLLVRWGLRPDAMIGHSVGEHVAACVAGVMDVDSTLDLIASRGRMIGSLPGGLMLVVHLSEAEATALCTPAISLAAVNAPRLCVLAGPEPDVRALMASLSEARVDHHLLHTSHAFHSAMMDPVLDGFTRQVAEHRLAAPTIPYVSGVTGQWLTPEQATAPGYWSDLLRGTVRFSDGLRTLARGGHVALVEVGPGRSLTTLAAQHAELGGALGVPMMRTASDEREDREVLLDALGQLWLGGVCIDWEQVGVGRDVRRIPLPGYPFERGEYWVPRAAGAPVVRTPSLERPPAVPRATVVAEPRDERSPIFERPSILRAVGPGRRDDVARYLASTLNDLLGHASSRPIAPATPLADLGVDSLTAIRLRHQIETELGVPIPIRHLLSATAASLVDLLLRGLQADASGRG